MWTQASRRFKAFDRVLVVITNATLALMMAAITADALGRYLFNRPLAGSMEATSLYFMVVVAFLGLPLAYVGGEHIRIEVFHKALLRIPGRFIDRLHALLAAFAFGFVAWHTGRLAWEKIAELETSIGTIQFPLYLSYVWVPIGTGYITIRLLIDVIAPPALCLHDETPRTHEDPA